MAGTACLEGDTDGIGGAASFSFPTGVATDNAGNVYVTDQNGIRKITKAGKVTTLACMPGGYGVATDRAGNVYVADTGNATIRKISPRADVMTLAGTVQVSSGSNGVGTAESITVPRGVATDRDGTDKEDD